MPTAWTARGGTGKPEISLGSDVDGIPQASNKPGVGYRAHGRGRPGHGEGHNSGQAVNVVAAIVVKQIMQRDKINGTLLLWPGSPRSRWRARRSSCAPASSRTPTSRSSRT
jgi:aminobenzoyl-glutamate utilization protein B